MRYPKEKKEAVLRRRCFRQIVRRSVKLSRKKGSAKRLCTTNEQHRHSALKLATPEERHRGEDKAILAARKALYEQAKQRHPERWSGNIRNWEPVGEVWLNPNNGETPQAEIRDLAA